DAAYGRAGSESLGAVRETPAYTARTCRHAICPLHAAPDRCRAAPRPCGRSSCLRPGQTVALAEPRATPRAAVGRACLIFARPCLIFAGNVFFAFTPGLPWGGVATAKASSPPALAGATGRVGELAAAGTPSRSVGDLRLLAVTPRTSRA